MKNRAIHWIESHRSLYEEMAVDLWEHPELGLTEHRSADRLIRFLEDHGFSVRKGVSGMPTAFVASWGSGSPVIGFCAEYDALPNLSQKPLLNRPEPVTPGAPGHGCGHNLLGPSSCFAAVAGKVALEATGVKGTIKVFGTPAEEALVGKVFMARDGVFEGTDVVISWHPYDRNEADYKSFNALTSARFHFQGRAAHTGSDPEQGRNALDAVELMGAGVDCMRKHLVQEARINYVITMGGDTPVTVVREAEAWYNIRAPRRMLVEEIWNWLLDIAHGAALMTQTHLTYRLLTATWEVLPNRVLARAGDANVSLLGAPTFSAEDQAFGDRMVQSLGREPEGPSFNPEITHPDLTRVFPKVDYVRVATDLGNVSWLVPTLHFRIAAKANGTPHHTWQMVAQMAAPPALKAGLKVSQWMAATALDCVNDPDLVAEAWREHRDSLAGNRFYHPVAPNAPVPGFREVFGFDPGLVPRASQTPQE